MLLAQTSKGLARVVNERYELLDIGDRSLSDVISTGDMPDLVGAPMRGVLDQGDVAFLAPIPRPGNLFIVGLNYEDHAAEVGLDHLPRVPRVHVAAASPTGHEADIPLPDGAPAAVDFEGEMAVVVGTTASRVSTADAWSHVAGITVANDVTARDVQFGESPLVAGPNVALAKSFNGFKPLGPALLTSDELREGEPLALRTRVDGELRQDSSTAEMCFSPAELVSYLSSIMTLRPGDVLLTGTPAGVGLSTSRFLQPGQVVEVELERVGTLRNRVVAA